MLNDSSLNKRFIRRCVLVKAISSRDLYRSVLFGDQEMSRIFKMNKEKTKKIYWPEDLLKTVIQICSGWNERFAGLHQQGNEVTWSYAEQHFHARIPEAERKQEPVVHPLCSCCADYFTDSCCYHVGNTFWN